jgi:hypothetical protein
VDNIKMDLREIGWDGMDWIELAQDRDQWRKVVIPTCRPPFTCQKDSWYSFVSEAESTPGP